MRLKPTKRAARRSTVAEAAVAAYSQWREECAAVGSTRWASASAVDEPLAFDAYNAALDREQRAATLYARLMGRAGHLVEIALAQVQTSSETR